MDEIKRSKEIAKVIIEKLSKEDLHDLLTIYDNNSYFDDYLIHFLFEKDKRNYPKEYFDFYLCRKGK